jgi:hypothetical protein
LQSDSPLPTGEIMQKLLALVAGAVPLLGTEVALAQNGQMMNGGMWNGGWMGGYGGPWVPILLVVVIGLVAWIVLQRRK